MKNRRILKLCKELLASVPIDNREDALAGLAQIMPQDLIFDVSVINLLIAKTVVTTDANLMFHFIDGSTYKYRICGNTPKGRKSINVRKEHHRRIRELYAKGMTLSEIAETLALPTSTVHSLCAAPEFK